VGETENEAQVTRIYISKTKELEGERVSLNGKSINHWSWPGICWMVGLLVRTFSLTKNMSISICLVWAWRVGFWARETPLIVKVDIESW